MYCAIIGDIVNSKEIQDREEFQEKFIYVIEKINTIFAGYIVSKFTVTLGDEFQGLLNSPIVFIDILDYINNSLNPINLRYGVGIGEITTRINNEKAIGADGPAYHNARRMIDEVKAKEKSKNSGKTNARFYSGNKEDELINVILGLCDNIEKGWTSSQRELIKYISENNRSQQEAAKHFGILQSSVSSKLKSASYYQYLNAKIKIKEYLEQK